MANRLETQFTRLLHRCETMASEKDHSGWRFEKVQIDDVFSKFIVACCHVFIGIAVNIPRHQKFAPIIARVDMAIIQSI